MQNTKMGKKTPKSSDTYILHNLLFVGNLLFIFGNLLFIILSTWYQHNLLVFIIYW